MRALKIAGAAVGAVIVIIALLLVIGIPSGFMTQQIQERVERATGYRLTINGGARIGIWPSLNMTLHDVTLQDPRDRDGDNRITAGSIQADVTLASVWAGKPQVTELVIVRPVVNVPLQRVRVKDTVPALKPTTASASEPFTVEHVSITGGTVVFSSHVMALVEGLCSHVAVMANGRIIAAGELAAVRGSAASLDDAFMHLVGASDVEEGGLTWLGSSPA